MKKLITKQKILQGNNQGFSLVELLLYIAILSIILLSLTQILVTALDLQLESRSSTTLDQDSRYIFSRLNYDILRADSISLPASLGDSGSTLQITVDGQTITYSLNGENLELSDSSDTNNLNGYNTTIVNATFERLGNVSGKNSIRYTIELQSKTLQTKGQQEQTIQSTVSTR